MKRSCTVVTLFLLAVLMACGPSPSPTLQVSAATAVPTGTSTPALTDTPTLIPPTATITPSPTISATATQAVPSGIAKGTVNVRSGPGTGFSILGKLRDTSPVVLVATSTDGKWWQIQYPTPDKKGWIAAEFVTVSGPVAALPTILVATPPPTHIAPTAVVTATVAASGINIAVLQGRIAYSGYNAVYLMNANGTDIHPVAQGQNPSLSLDGTKLAYATTAQSDDQGVWRLDLATGQQNQVYKTKTDSGFFGLAISPDGNRVAYGNNIWERGRNRQFGCGGTFGWSADGAWLACIGMANGQFGLVKVLADDDSHPIFLTLTGAQPAWSPDGSKIAFVRFTSSRKSEIWMMNSDGTDAHLIVPGDTGGSMPTWSPDGQYIAFLSYRNGGYDIYVMKPDGSRQTQLTNTKVNKVGVPGGSGLSWSR
ncbi:MAG: SH3 domain-containing protein [Anaerolineae bacterium]